MKNTMLKTIIGPETISPETVKYKWLGDENLILKKLSLLEKIIHDSKQIEKNKSRVSYTHTSLGKPWGTYVFTDENLDIFHDIYGVVYDVESKNDDIGKGPKYHFHEVPKDTTILFVDIDFKSSSSKRLYIDSTIYVVVKTVFDIIKKYFNVEKFHDPFVCYVTEKSNPEKNKNIWKDGIHFFFPNIFFTKSMNEFIISILLKISKEKNLLGDIISKDECKSKKYEEIIDVGCAKNGIMIYGCTKIIKEKEKLPYTVTKKIYYDENNEMISEKIEDPRLHNFTKYLSLRKFTNGMPVAEYLDKNFVPTIETSNSSPDLQKNNNPPGEKKKEMISIEGAFGKKYTEMIKKTMKLRKNNISEISDNEDDIDEDDEIEHEPKKKIIKKKNNSTISDEEDEEDHEPKLKKKVIKKKVTEKKNNVHIISYKFKTKNDHTNEINKIARLVSLFSKSRSVEYKPWISVAIALKSISLEHPVSYEKYFLDIFKKFSKRCIEKYDEKNIRERWTSLKNISGNGNVGRRCINLWASYDDNDEYMKITTSYWNNVILQIAYNDYATIAQMFNELYGINVVCVSQSSTHRIWYSFDGSIWRKSGGSTYIKSIMNNQFTQYLSKFKTETKIKNRNNLDEDQDEDAFEKNMKKLNPLNRIITSLRTPNYKGNIEKELITIVEDNDFESKLDIEGDIIAFQNGIYDLTKKTFRKTNPTDYISMTTGYMYPGDKNIIDKDSSGNYIYSQGKEIEEGIIFYENFFNSIHIDEKVRRYRWLVTASHLLSGNKRQKFYISVGEMGANGKSAYSKAMEYLLGDYFGSLQSSFITSLKKDSSSASPDLKYISKKKYVVLPEPEKREVIQSGFFKLVSGGDGASGRQLYDGSYSKTLMCSFEIFANHKPKLSTVDGGVLRRIEVTLWTTEFVNFIRDKDGNVCTKKVYKNDKKIDRLSYHRERKSNLNENLKKYRASFMWLLLHKYYPMYEEEMNGPEQRLIVPTSIVEENESYKQENDPVYNFLLTMYTKTDKQIDKISISKIYSDLKVLKSNFNRELKKIKNEKVFIEMLKKDEYYNIEEKVETKKKKSVTVFYLVGWKEISDEDNYELFK